VKPESLTFEEAASVPVAALTALQGLRDKGRIQPGHEVLINGAAGGVGTFSVQIAKSFGTDVTGVCSTRNVDFVRSLGSGHRLHARGFHQKRATLRLDSRQRWQPFFVRLQARFESQGHLRHRRSTQEPFGFLADPYAYGACVVAIREPEVHYVHCKTEQGRLDHHV